MKSKSGVTSTITSQHLGVVGTSQPSPVGHLCHMDGSWELFLGCLS